MRRSERQKKAIEALNVSAAVSDALGCYRAAVRNPDISDLEKARLSVPIITKHMVSKVEGELKTDTVLQFTWLPPVPRKTE
jgi:hypothetical protein